MQKVHLPEVRSTAPDPTRVTVSRPGTKNAAGGIFRSLLNNLGNIDDVGGASKRLEGVPISGHAPKDGAARDDLPLTPERERPARHGFDDRGLGDTAPFAVPPAILAPPAGPAPAPAAGSAAAHAETAALVERLVTSMRVGRVGERGREVRMRLSLGSRQSSGDVDVQLRWEHGQLSAVLEAPPHTVPEARRIADQLEQALADRDIDVAQVRVVTSA